MNRLYVSCLLQRLHRDSLFYHLAPVAYAGRHSRRRPVGQFYAGHHDVYAVLSGTLFNLVGDIEVEVVFFDV